MTALLLALLLTNPPAPVVYEPQTPEILMEDVSPWGETDWQYIA